MLNTLCKRLMAMVWPSLAFCYHLYRLAIAVGIFAVIKAMLLRERQVSPFLGYLFCALVSAGFFIWLTKFAVRILRHETSKTVVTLLHAGVLLAAYLCSRWSVALAIGLPSKDFDGSVAVTTIVCAALLYIVLMALGCFVIATGCLLVAPVLESAWLVSRIPWITRPREYIAKRFEIRFFDQPESERRPTSLNLAAHWMGGLLVSCLFASALQLALDASVNDSQLMKHLAYYVDYQLADRYPGVPTGQRFVLHDNNVISLARLVDGKVVIAVGVFEPQKGITELSTYQ